MKKTINSEHIEGYLFDHTIEEKTVGNKESANYGKTYLAGVINVAVDEEMLNVIPVHFSYVTPTTKAGKVNNTYTALNAILANDKTVTKVGKDEAYKVKVDTALALNEWYNNEDSLVSTKTNEGGFVTLVSTLTEKLIDRTHFDTDMVITSIVHVDENPEKYIMEPYTSIRGAVFTFRNELLPVEYVAKNPDAMRYFESLDIAPSEPIFTKIWGQINCISKKEEIVEQSAFGEPSVRTVEHSSKEWVVTGTSKVPYDFGDEKVLTAEELQTKMAEREVMLAELKKKHDDAVASKTSSNNAISSGFAASGVPAAAPAKNAKFNF